MLAYWRELARQDGLPGLYFIFQKQHALPNDDCLNSFDALFQFQPFEAVSSPSNDKRSLQNALLKLTRGLPERYQIQLRELRKKLIRKPTCQDYDETWRQILNIRPDPTLTTFPGAFVDWDNTARYKKKAKIFRGANPEKFSKWLTLLVGSMPSRNLPENYIFLNAWNEWSESAYLEPDEQYGYQYLEAIKRALLE
jgi:hypothetical protein